MGCSGGAGFSYAGRPGRGQGSPARGKRRPEARLRETLVFACERGGAPSWEVIPAPFSSAIAMVDEIGVGDRLEVWTFSKVRYRYDSGFTAFVLALILQ